MTQPQGMPRSRGTGGHGADQVFADPSGQRRRLMRLLGAGGSVLLVGALVLTGLGLFGGPDTPFSVFSAPSAGHGKQGTAGQDDRASHRAGARDRGTAGSGPQPGSPTAPAPSPRPSGSAGPSSPAPNPSTSPTNGAGRTPPGQSRSKPPHPSPSSTHAK